MREASAYDPAGRLDTVVHVENGRTYPRTILVTAFQPLSPLAFHEPLGKRFTCV